MEIINSAFQQRIISYRINPTSFHLNVSDLFKEILTKITKIIEKEQQKHNMIKMNLELFGLYLNPKDETHHIKSFNTPYRVICDSSNIKTEVDEMIQIIDRKADELAEKDSGNIFLNQCYEIIFYKQFYIFYMLIIILLFQVGYY